MAKRKFSVKKSLGGPQEYRKWEDYESGDVVVGKFMGIHTCQYKKKNYKIKVLDASFVDSELSESLIGKVLVLNSSAILEKHMADVEEGEIIQMEYTGKTVVSKGPFAGKDMHTMSIDIVEMDEEEEGDGL